MGDLNNATPLMSRCNTLKYPIVVSFTWWKFWVWDIFYYKPLYSEVNRSSIKIILAENWEDVLAWKQIFTKFEKKNHMNWESFQVFNKQRQNNSDTKKTEIFTYLLPWDSKMGLFSNRVFFLPLLHNMNQLTKNK